ncbi:MAG: transposase [Deltaproteobacteria bacterium]|nr:transposase [Deltaproteobacteria bacterium]
MLENLRLFIKGIYEVRGDPTIDLPQKFFQELTQLQGLSEQHRDHEHNKTRNLARELLNDWDAIWKVLEYPELPITNNVAERSLWHWVITRKISHGTRTKQGSHAFTLLTSVIDTCRQRGILPWPYLAEVIAERRNGNAVPPLRYNQVFDKLPKRLQDRAKAHLREIMQAPIRQDALTEISCFVLEFEEKYSKATQTLTKDQNALLTFS